MKKTTFITIILIFCLSFVKAQNWDTVGCWGLGQECGGYTYAAQCLMVYNGALYAGGAISGPGQLQTNDIAKWDGSSWDSLQGGMPSCGGPIAMGVYNGRLIVGGNSINHAGRIAVNNIASWNDTTWAQLGTGINIDGEVIGMTVYNGNLYVTGTFDTAGGIPVNKIARWNGTSWSAVGTGISGNGSYGAALCVYKGKLYVGGHFTIAGGNPAQNIATWDGTNWAALPGGNIDSFGVSSLSIYNGNLYAGGSFNIAGNIKANNIAQWNGSSWLAVGIGINGRGVGPLQVYNGDLYVGGSFDSAGSIMVNNFAMWDGTNWHYAPGFTQSIQWLGPAWINSLAVYKGSLFACGSFDSAGGMPTMDIAGNFGGVAGINKISLENNFKVYPNPNKGQFNLSLSHPELVSGTQIIEIYNILGEQVYNAMLKQVQHDYEINLSNQPNGVYLYRVSSETGNLLGQGKIVIDK